MHQVTPNTCMHSYLVGPECRILYHNSGTCQDLHDIRLITFVARQRHLSVTLVLYYRGLYRVLGIQDICHFTSRDIGYYPFYFQGYRILCSIFSLLPGILNI